MIDLLLVAYKKYNLSYDAETKRLVSYVPIRMCDFVNIKNIIKKHNLPIEEIRVLDWGRY